MNYIHQLNAFEDWLESNHLAGPEQLLWYKLVALNNKFGWPEWFFVTNITLQAKMGSIDEKTLIRYKNKLKQVGLIDFIPGKKSSPSKYKIVNLYEKAGIMPVNMPVQVPVNMPVQVPVNMPDKLNVKPKPKPKKDINMEKVTEIFNHYVSLFGSFFRAYTLTADRKAKIEARLTAGYSVDQIKQAMSNIRQSPYHCGENDNGKFYADITFVCRNDSKLEEWINYAPDLKKERFPPIKKQGFISAVGEGMPDLR